MRFPPLAVLLLLLLAGVLLHRLIAPWPIGLPFAARWGGAALLGVAGVGTEAAALMLFRRTRQDPLPWTATPEIVAVGVYRVSRNPMYVGMALLQAAVGVGLDNAWILALTPLLLAILFVIAVRPEEAYLERRFGDSYREYKRSVRRWL